MKDLFGHETIPELLTDGFATPETIIEYAVEAYNPVKVLLLFSGGHDSLCSTHKSASVLKEMGIEFIVYHGDTTIGIPETQQFVRDVCEYYNWNLEIRKPPKKEDWYESIVRENGFPGSTKIAHQFMYRRLKERALRNFITHECKSSPHARENVLLISGVRKSESAIRMGYSNPVQKQGSAVWGNPIFYWRETKCKAYMGACNLPRNPVKDNICISGECLCGAFAGREEFSEIEHFYPETADRIKNLHEKAKENGFPWPWSMGPTDWNKAHPEGVGELGFPMCVGCENKHEYKPPSLQGVKNHNKRS